MRQAGEGLDMGWAHCGNDSTGRPIGYAIEATCDHVGCDEQIWRGVDSACGGMHGEAEHTCERYFCEEHREYIDVGCIAGGYGARVCLACAKHWNVGHVPVCMQCCAKADDELHD